MGQSKNFIVNCGTYDFDVMVSLGQTDKEVKNALLEYNIPKKEIKSKEAHKLSGSCRYTLFDSNASLIRLYGFPVDPRHFGTLAHEILHCVHHVLRSLGMKPTRASEEAYAYLTGHLTEKIYERIFETDSKSDHTDDTLQPTLVDGVDNKGSNE